MTEKKKDDFKKYLLFYSVKVGIKIMPYTLDGDLKTHSPQYPAWVYAGAGFLAAIAGYVNVLMLEFFSVPVSHMSGALSRLSIDLGEQKLEDLKWILSILGGFLLGAFLSGLIIGNPRLKPGRRYGVTLIFEGILLSFAAVLSQQGYQLAVSMAAMACGLQNAMASSYYGLIIRTTHVTGIITDMGVLLGQWVRGRSVAFWKLRLLMTIALSFFLGGYAAMRIYPLLGFRALYLSSIFCFLAGIAYLMFVLYLRRRRK